MRHLNIVVGVAFNIMPVFLPIGMVFVLLSVSRLCIEPVRELLPQNAGYVQIILPIGKRGNIYMLTFHQRQIVNLIFWWIGFVILIVCGTFIFWINCVYG